MRKSICLAAVLAAACHRGAAPVPAVNSAAIEDPATLVERGEYIVRNVAVCGGCHGVDHNADGPLSGGMDRFALRCANLLAGNEEGAAVLEAVFLGPELEFTEDATVAVTGAELPPKVDGIEHETWTAFRVRKGQVLSFGYLKQGARAYIAVSGGVDVPVVRRCGHAERCRALHRLRRNGL